MTGRRMTYGQVWRMARTVWRYFVALVRVDLASRRVQRLLDRPDADREVLREPTADLEACLQEAERAEAETRRTTRA